MADLNYNNNLHRYGISGTPNGYGGGQQQPPYTGYGSSGFASPPPANRVLFHPPHGSGAGRGQVSLSPLRHFFVVQFLAAVFGGFCFCWLLFFVSSFCHRAVHF